LKVDVVKIFSHDAKFTPKTAKRSADFGKFDAFFGLRTTPRPHIRKKWIAIPAPRWYSTGSLHRTQSPFQEESDGKNTMEAGHNALPSAGRAGNIAQQWKR